ncbi:hypothetical protein V2J09_002665 [Rumex salicifolius]
MTQLYCTGTRFCWSELMRARDESTEEYESEAIYLRLLHFEPDQSRKDDRLVTADSPILDCLDDIPTYGTKELEYEQQNIRYGFNGNGHLPFNR